MCRLVGSGTPTPRWLMSALAAGLAFACGSHEETPSSSRVKEDLGFSLRVRSGDTVVGVPVDLELEAVLFHSECVPGSGILSEDHCTLTDVTTPFELVDLECSGVTCAATGELQILATTEGRATVVATVRVPKDLPVLAGQGAKASGGDPYLYEVSTDLVFTKLEEVAILSEPGADAGTRYASLVGAELGWWIEPRSAGKAVALPADAVQLTWTGDAVAPLEPPAIAPDWAGDYWAGVSAVKSGTATLRVVAADITRLERIRIASPDEVTGISVTAVPSMGEDVSDDLLDGATPLDTLELTAGTTYATIAVVLALQDGATALGGAGLALVSPPEIATVKLVGNCTAGEACDAASPVLRVSGLQPGNAQLSIAVGSALVTLPVVVR